MAILLPKKEGKQNKIKQKQRSYFRLFEPSPFLALLSVTKDIFLIPNILAYFTLSFCLVNSST